MSSNRFFPNLERLGLIAALTADRVIALHGQIPWHHPADLKRFKRLTVGTTVVMGRRTWESLPRRPLPDRENLVVSRARGGDAFPGARCFPTLEAALAAASGTVWCIGGAELYAAALRYADLVDLTWVPEVVEDPAALRFPTIDERELEPGPIEPLDGDPALRHQVFTRRSTRSVCPPGESPLS